MSSEALMESSWLEVLKEEFDKPYTRALESFLASEYQSGKTVYPPFERVFEAFCHTPFSDVKVVIMGQDPYHGPNQAHGLSFSVQKGVAIPPSLQNIYREIESDLHIKPPKHGSLVGWAKQGVLLLNATLTVRASEPKSHFKRGWETFTDKVAEKLVERRDPIVFMLWGKSAWEKFAAFGKKGEHHLFLTSPHPSPLSAHAGFFGNHHFSRANEFLKGAGKEPIDWSLKDLS